MQEQPQAKPLAVLLLQTLKIFPFHRSAWAQRNGVDPGSGTRRSITLVRHPKMPAEKRQGSGGGLSGGQDYSDRKPIVG